MIALYFDIQVPNGIAVALRRAGVDVLTAREDGRATAADPAILDRAHELERVLVTYDRDFEIESRRRLTGGATHRGIVLGHPENVSVRQTISDLTFIGLVGNPEDLANLVTYLPMR